MSWNQFLAWICLLFVVVIVWNFIGIFVDDHKAEKKRRKFEEEKFRDGRHD